ncbi:L,D-transpeptidase family protein [Candidatus Woesearchaeota archaeon]|nr:L,D-transpeptidase family protein [Candidatus Woesearchaeota archaeon]
MYYPAKGIVKYLSMLMLGATVYMGHCDPRCSAASESHAAAQPLKPQPAAGYCTQEQKKEASALEVRISRSSQTLRLEAVLPEEKHCTILEQRVVMGGYRTPKIDAYITHAMINPSWKPTWSIMQELKQKHSKSYIRRNFYHRDGVYMKPGPKNPLGKVKFVFDWKGFFRMHGTNDENRHLFDKKKRNFSHGCIRVEDEVALLKAINSYTGNTDSCDDRCIDSSITAGTTRKLVLSKKVKIKVTK